MGGSDLEEPFEVLATGNPIGVLNLRRHGTVSDRPLGKRPLSDAVSHRKRVRRLVARKEEGRRRRRKRPEPTRVLSPR